MKRISTWWQSWTHQRTARRANRRRAAGRLETLEQRLNLAAVLVVETVDAYWLIEEPRYGSLPSSTAADPLWSQEWFGETNFDGLLVTLPDSVAPAAASGGSLSNSDSELITSMLDDLWLSEPDFFYEDVLAVTFFTDTTMDALIASGLFDGNSSAFTDAGLFGGGFPASSGLGSFGEFVPDVGDLAGFLGDDHVALNELETLGAVDASDVLVGAAGADAIALTDAEIAAWTEQLETGANARKQALRAATDDDTRSVAMGLARPANTEEPAPQVEARLSLPPSVRDALAAMPQVVATGNTTIARDVMPLDAYFARLPSVFAASAGRSAVLRWMGVAAEPASDTPQDEAALLEDASFSLSYSQWAALLGVAGLTAASLWQQCHDEESTRSPLHLKTRPRPVVG